MGRLLLELTPVGNGFRPVAVDFQPGHRFREGRAVEESSLRPERRIEIEQPVLKRDDLVKPFDVAPRDRQESQFNSPLERIRGKALPPADETDGEEERPRENSVAQRVWSIVKASPVSIERGDGATERILVSDEFGRDGPEQARRPQLVERGFSVPRSQDFVVLLDEPCGRASGDLVLVSRDRLENRRVNLEFESCRQHDRAEHANGILEKADVRIADRANDARIEIPQSADVVDNRKGRDVVKEGVDREIATERVLFWGAVGVIPINEPISRRRGRDISAVVLGDFRTVRRVRQLEVTLRGGHLFAERGDFDDFGSELDVRQTEPTPDDPAVAKEFLDLVWLRRGADVEILRAPTEQEVADGTADEIRRVTALVQPIEHLEGVGINVTAGNRMCGPRNDRRLDHLAGDYSIIRLQRRSN